MADGIRREPEDISLNLAPIMSILVILIPVLLYAFTFFEVTMQAVAGPRFYGHRPAAEEKPLNLTVIVTGDGFEVRHRDGELPIIGKRADERYDYAALYTVLSAVKAEFPKETRVNVGADETVPWRVLARTMDAVRLRLERDRYEDPAAWSEAAPRLDDAGVPVALFDRVTLVVAE